MNRKINSILVLGLGKVGSLLATLLHENKYSVTGLVLKIEENFPFPVVETDLSDLE